MVLSLVATSYNVKFRYTLFAAYLLSGITYNLTYSLSFDTSESVWTPPEEGYMTLAEQEEEAKEETLQRELMEQLEKEKAIEEADTLEEQRANAERERMKKLKRPVKKTDAEDDEENVKIKRETTEEERPYWRDYSVPERPQPYGSWQVVETM